MGVHLFTMLGSSYLLVSSLLVSPQTDRHVCTVVAAFCANGLAASVVLFVEPGIWYHCWVTEGARGSSTSRLEQPHKQERHHTLIQNLKGMGLWVLLFIRCLTFTFLSDVGHITHTYTQQAKLKILYWNINDNARVLLCVMWYQVQCL